jgi:uncharacterized protein (DUF1499 family)
LLAGLVAAVFVGSAAPLYRYGGFDLGHSFAVMTWGTYAAGGALALGVIWILAALFGRSGAGLGSVILAAILAVGAAYVPVTMKMKAESVPFIHDITTDTANPPVFVAIAPLRAEAPNGTDYKTDPAEQQKGYPDIQPMVSDLAPDLLFDRALKTVREMGWEIVAEAKTEGRIEATETTQWWGFKDDVVIRVVAEGSGSKLDVRSMSRVGKSDVGKNAERIRLFLAKVKAAN